MAMYVIYIRIHVMYVMYYNTCYVCMENLVLITDCWQHKVIKQIGVQSWHFPLILTVTRVLGYSKSVGHL